jgi:hypothetical protein
MHFALKYRFCSFVWTSTLSPIANGLELVFDKASVYLDTHMFDFPAAVERGKIKQ